MVMQEMRKPVIIDNKLFWWEDGKVFEREKGGIGMNVHSELTISEKHQVYKSLFYPREVERASDRAKTFNILLTLF